MKSSIGAKDIKTSLIRNRGVSQNSEVEFVRRRDNTQNDSHEYFISNPKMDHKSNIFHDGKYMRSKTFV